MGSRAGNVVSVEIAHLKFVIDVKMWLLCASVIGRLKQQCARTAFLKIGFIRLSGSKNNVKELWIFFKSVSYDTYTM